jgi:phosphoglycerol geranylgeranyltransferase
MRFVYLEAGSGVKRPVPPSMIRAVKNTIKVPLVVGGGIRSSKQAREAVEAGADAIVTGNVTEEGGQGNQLKELISNVRRR